MTAADLPECRCGGPLDMAKRLCTYMDDPTAIRRAIKHEFDINIPDARTIRKLRAAYLHKPAESPPQPCDAWRPIEASENAREASNRFLQAIERERALSVERAYRQGALKAPALRYPELVDKVWERETDQAWRENGELTL